jgi:hypothetical protein
MIKSIILEAEGIALRINKLIARITAPAKKLARQKGQVAFR